jgi:hypothetical protein
MGFQRKILQNLRTLILTKWTLEVVCWLRLVGRKHKIFETEVLVKYKKMYEVKYNLKKIIDIEWFTQKTQ